MGYIIVNENRAVVPPVTTYSIVPTASDPYITVSGDYLPDASIGQVVIIGQYRIRILERDILTASFICMVEGVQVWRYRWQSFSGGLRWKFRAWWRFTFHLWGWRYSPRDEDNIRAMWEQDNRR